MNYFLINHKYHLNFIKIYFPLDLLEKSVVLVNAYLLYPEDFSSGQFKDIIFLKNDNTGFNILGKVDKVKVDIETNRLMLSSVKAEDTLYVFTEMDFVNLWVIQFYSNHKAKVNLVEDGTYTASYYPLKKNYFEFYNFFRFALKQLLLYKIKQSIFEISNIRYSVIGREICMKLQDSIYESVCITCNYKIGRHINSHVLTRESVVSGCHTFRNGVGILFNSMHYYDIPFDKYLKILGDALVFIPGKFQINTLYFIFHPRENETARSAIMKILLKHSYVKILDDTINVRTFVIETKAEYHFGFITGAILEYESFAANSVYLIKYYPEIINTVIADNFLQFVLQKELLNPKVLQ